MSIVASLQGLVLLALGLVALGMCGFALVDAARHRPDAYLAAGKRTKRFWVVILSVATALAFVAFDGGLGYLSLVAVVAVAAGIYLADVRPALRAVSGRRGGGTHHGPYGPW